jgi:hypothetical protein
MLIYVIVGAVWNHFYFLKPLAAPMKQAYMLCAGQLQFSHFVYVPGSIPGASRFSENQQVWNGVHSASWGQLRSYLKEKVAAPV